MHCALIYVPSQIVISKAQIKLIHSLALAKYRRQEGLFVAEGPKIIEELTRYANPVMFFDDEKDVQKVSFLQHPQGVLAVFRIADFLKKRLTYPTKEHLVLALDGVRDPGNVGTIIRLADWFGIDTILCSQDTADCWNPKVVQATMGSIARVRIEVCQLLEYIKALPMDIPIYGTLLNGNDIYREQLAKGGLIIMGNEGNGISQQVGELITKPLLIPSYRQGAESLNVAIATAITLSEFRRR